ncbi:hypothetical protein, partial [Arcanobacterium bovis]
MASSPLLKPVSARRAPETAFRAAVVRFFTATRGFTVFVAGDDAVVELAAGCGEGAGVGCGAGIGEGGVTGSAGVTGTGAGGSGVGSTGVGSTGDGGVGIGS